MGKEKELEGWVKEARERLWSAEYARRNDERIKGESEDHWKKRRKRNQERVLRREEVLKHLQKKLEALREKKDEESPIGHRGIGFATFDGKTVALWMVPFLKASREHGWSGVVVSGVRTPEYSEQLCYNMCGAPTCPGRCAGRASNHNMTPTQGYPFGALDVSDYDNFERIQFEIDSPLRNALPIDPVHFSVSGR